MSSYLNNQDPPQTVPDKDDGASLWHREMVSRFLVLSLLDEDLLDTDVENSGDTG